MSWRGGLSALGRLLIWRLDKHINMAVLKQDHTAGPAGDAQNGTSTHANVDTQPFVISQGADTELPTNGSTKPSAYPKSRVELVDRFVDEPRKLRVAVIGGGLAGIISGCLLPAKVPGVEIVIYEKNADFVSSLWTWPGPSAVACTAPPDPD